MNYDPKFQYFKCEGPALEILKAYKVELQAMVDSQMGLHKEFTERSEKLQKHHQSNLRGMWRRMAAMVGLDPDTTWGRLEYQVETKYLDEGFGAITFAPQPSIQELLGGNPVEQLKDLMPEIVPDKSKLN